MNVLVTGGAGYIGSHTCLELLGSGYGVVVVDNLCNSSAKSLDRVRELTGKEITQINIDLIPAADRATYRQQALGDLVVTEEMKNVIIRSANYALNEENRWSVPVQEAN